MPQYRQIERPGSDMVSIGIVGSTGLVGEEFLKLINHSPLHFENVMLFNSQKKQKGPILLKGKLHDIHPVSHKLLDQCDLLFFMAGSDVATQFIPHIKHAISVDLSSAFRRIKEVPLIIPEINGSLLEAPYPVISSPNCTTTILLMALFPLHKQFGIKRIHASTYQAASGGGKKLLFELLEETKRFALKKNLSMESLQSAFNIYPHPDKGEDISINLEEDKMVFETKKILGSQDIKIHAQCIRVPTLRVHGISLFAEFNKPLSKSEVSKAIAQFPGVEILSEKGKRLNSNEVIDKKQVFLSNIRIDPEDPYRISCWALGDQLLKGAALNAYQILEILYETQVARSKL